MSISLPNGTLLANPATQTQYTAAVTRILHLSNFPKELKTRDLQLMFKDFESEKGGFRIKWVDDTNALAVFGEASIAKRAYLSFLLRPPPNFPSPAKIHPYDGPDAGKIISTITARSMGHRASMSSTVQNQSDLVSGPSRPPVPSNGFFEPSKPSIDRESRNSVGGMGSFSFPKQQRNSISSSSTSLLSNTQPGNGSALGGERSTLIGIGVNSSNRHQRNGSATSSFSRTSNSGVLNFSNNPIGGGGNNTSTSTSGLASRLPTHSESLDSPAAYIPSFPVRRTTKDNERDLLAKERNGNNRSRNGGGGESNSSSDNEPILVLDHAPTPTPPSGGLNGHGRGIGSKSGLGGWKMPGTGGSSGLTLNRSRSDNSQNQQDINNGSSVSGNGPNGGSARRDSVSAEKALREVEKALAGVEAR